MIVRYELRHTMAQAPRRSHDSDSGADVFSCEHVTIHPGDTAVVRTGIALELPRGYEAQLRPRSGNSARGLLVHYGTIDEEYRGEVRVCVTNLSRQDAIVRIGDRIAQLVVAPVVRAVFREASGQIDASTVRGQNGFGSTGR